jgi:hypothetical protein
VRIGVDFEARYGSVGTTPRFEARVTEISTSGLRLRTGERRLQLGMSVDIAFDCDTPSRPSRMTLRMRARIVRVVLDEAPPFEYGLIVVDDDSVKNSLRQAVLDITLSRPPEVRRY